jgi:CheY-like chemotaxis protein
MKTKSGEACSCPAFQSSRMLASDWREICCSFGRTGPCLARRMLLCLSTPEKTVNQFESTFETSSPQPPLPSRVPDTPGLILVVEDEDFVREIIGEVLQAEGYRVLKARTAAEARIAVSRFGDRLNLLLTDVVLPDQGGIALAGHCRSVNADLPVLFMSGYPEATFSSTARECKGYSYLSKPFSAERLLREVRHALAKEFDEIAI